MKTAYYLLLSSLLILFELQGFSQGTIHNVFGKGIQGMAKDSSFSVKFGIRFQTQYEGINTLTNDTAFTGEIYEDRFYLRRARLKLDGYVFSPKIVYKIEYDLPNAQILDAVLKWNFAGNFSLWAGQTKLPGNRERVISSQKLQFVDRSLLNARYQLDRDQGLQLRHHFSLGSVVIREIISASVGEGMNYITLSGKSGYDYTERIEILPFGVFSGNGDYVGGDLQREEKVKLALGFTYDYNDNAIRERGQTGDELSEMRDITTFFADLMFKYKGLSIMAEYANRSTTKSPEIIDSTGTQIESFYTGIGLNTQVGYVLKSNWEFAGRYTSIIPERITGNKHLSMVTFAISKYIVGHNLKVQGDISYYQQENSDDQLLFRLQLEVAL
ncbi:MAG TPA: FmdC precursor [Flavobacteriales bacterium]|nr:FmdC precursor [Flavobacteriales bacterium]